MRRPSVRARRFCTFRGVPRCTFAFPLTAARGVEGGGLYAVPTYLKKN